MKKCIISTVEYKIRTYYNDDIRVTMSVDLNITMMP